MSTGSQTTLPRRVGVMTLLTFIEVTDTASKLFTYSLPVITVAAVAGGPTGAFLCAVGLLGWAAHIGGELARAGYDSGYPSGDASTPPPPAEMVGLIVYAALTVGLAGCVGAVGLVVAPTVGVVSAAATPPLADMGHRYHWVLNPAAIPVAVGLRLATGGWPFAGGAALPPLTVADPRRLLARRQY